MPAGGLVIAGLGAALGAGQAIYGASQKKKYQRQLDALSANMPKYQTPAEEAYMVNLAESRANQGMGAGARQQLQNNADRTLSTLSNAALMGGADANSLASLAEKVQSGYNQNAIYDDQVRLQNLNNLSNAWARQSANKDKEWQINQYQPWKNKMAAVNQQLLGAVNMQNAGMSQLGSGLMSAGGALTGMMGSGSGSSGMPATMGGGPSVVGPSSMGGYGGYDAPTPFYVNESMGGPSSEYPTTAPMVTQTPTFNYWQ